MIGRSHPPQNTRRGAGRSDAGKGVSVKSIAHLGPVAGVGLLGLLVLGLGLGDVPRSPVVDGCNYHRTAPRPRPNHVGCGGGLVADGDAARARGRWD